MRYPCFLLLAAAPLLAQTTQVPNPSPLPKPPPAPAAAPKDVTRLFLWKGESWKAVEGEKETDPDEASIDIYPVSINQPTAAVVVLPGGGYGGLSTDWEGKKTAAFLNKFGLAAFVVRYRHAPRFRYPLPLEDAQRAIQLVRAKAAEYKVRPDQIGVIGYSAGGHLASLALTRFDAGKTDAPDPIDRVSSRPDFGILVYPVITFTAEPFIHQGSRRNLLGDDLSLSQELSSELHVRKDTPPIFLVSGGEDKTVPPENSILFYQACRKEGVPAELHIYQTGGHGLGAPRLQTWHEWVGDWMARNGWIPAPGSEAIEIKKQD